MYTSFGVKNFRCFRDLQLDDLGRVNLIAGRNNSGKTALLEAIYLHSGDRKSKTFLRDQSYTSRMLYDYRRPRDFDVDSTSIISWDTIFNNFDTAKSIEMSARLSRPYLTRSQHSLFDKNLKISIKSQDSEDFDDILGQFRMDSILRRFEIEVFDVYRNGEMLEINSDYSPSSDYMLILYGTVHSSRFRSKPFIRSDFFHTREKVDSRVNAQRFSNVKQSNTDSILIDALRIVEPKLKTLEVLYDGTLPRIHANIGLVKSIPLSSLGEGMNRLASLILAMGETAQGVIFIDEIENGLHYAIQKKVWQVIGQIARDLDIQVFATTHSLEMIRAAHEAFKDDDPYDFRYHRLDRNADTGDIEAMTYNEFDMEAVASFDFDFEVRG